jgi:hypothetical protein
VTERSAEITAYVVAFLALVIGGVVMRTLILNFFVGPMIVVVTVGLLTPALTRRHRS